jgi:hypothetical protein
MLLLDWLSAVRVPQPRRRGIRRNPIVADVLEDRAAPTSILVSPLSEPPA